MNWIKFMEGGCTETIHYKVVNTMKKRKKRGKENI